MLPFSGLPLTLSSKGLLALDSAQRTLAVYAGQMSSSTITLQYPDGTTANPFGQTTSTTSFLFSATDMNNNPGGILNGFRITHEMGHIIQGQLWGGLPDYDCIGVHGMWDIEYEGCATNEGWADYVSFVSWWNPDSSSARPSLDGDDFENANPVYWQDCATNAKMEGQVVKSFWDLDDANNEGAGYVDMDHDGFADDLVDGNNNGTPDADVQNSTTAFLADGWAAFSAGTNNHQKSEPGSNARNMYDYDFNAGTGNTTALYHNCIAAQEP